MKKIYLLFFILFCFTNCDNDDDAPQNPADQLPEATQTGAGTFACLVDGKPFIGDNPYFNCFYQYVDGGYYFGVQGLKKVEMLTAINIGTYKKSISEGEVLSLIEPVEGNAWGGGGFLLDVNSSRRVETDTEYTGELKITKLDFENRIVSGIFWFDLIHPYGRYGKNP